VNSNFRRGFTKEAMAGALAKGGWNLTKNIGGKLWRNKGKSVTGGFIALDAGDVAGKASAAANKATSIAGRFKPIPTGNPTRIA